MAQYEKSVNDNRLSEAGAYFDSLKNPKNLFSGDVTLLPRDISDKWYRLESIEENYYTEHRYYHPDERKEYADRVKQGRKDLKESLEALYHDYIGPRSVSEPETFMKQSKETLSKTKYMSNNKEESPVQEQTKGRERKAPQLITVNGDKISHAHVYKSNKSDDWLFTAKVNDVPLRSRVISAADMEAFMGKTKSVEQMMQDYFPTKLMAKVPAEGFRMPQSIQTPKGDQEITKFCVYKENDQSRDDYGKYKFYAQVGDQKMSETARKDDLDKYFDRVMTPVQMVSKIFGERLNLASHYEQFKLPEGVKLDDKAIQLTKNNATNRFEISANLGEYGTTSAREISYNDRLSYFSHKTANKEQLAAKYLGDEMKLMIAAGPKKQVEEAKQAKVSL